MFQRYQRERNNQNLGEQDFINWAQVEAPDMAESSARLTFRRESSIEYGRGHEVSMDELAQANLIGGYMYSTMGDLAVRPSHKILDGKVFPPDDRRLLPPNGWNCRCTFVLVPPGTPVEDKTFRDSLVAQVALANGTEWLGSPMSNQRLGVA